MALAGLVRAGPRPQLEGNNDRREGVRQMREGDAVMDESCTCLDGYPCGCWSPSFCMCEQATGFWELFKDEMASQPVLTDAELNAQHVRRNEEAGG